MDKPVITAVNGSNPSGMGGVVGSPQPQSLNISGTGFAPGLVLVFESAYTAPQVLRSPQVQLTDTGAIAVVDVPVPTPGTVAQPTWIAWAVANNIASDAFSFQVGKS